MREKLGTINGTEGKFAVFLVDDRYEIDLAGGLV
jgi:hypothetical protein